MTSSERSNSPEDESSSKLSLIIPASRLRSSSTASSTSFSDSDTSCISPRAASISVTELFPLPSPTLPGDEAFSSDHSIFNGYGARVSSSSTSVSRQSSLRYTKSVNDESGKVFEVKDAIQSVAAERPSVRSSKPRISDTAEIVVLKKATDTERKKRPEDLSISNYNQFKNMQREKIRQTSSMVLYDSREQSPDKESESQTKFYEAYDHNGNKHRWNEFKQLGRGAFSRVILGRSAAEDHEHPGLVAIKIVTLGSKNGGNSARQQIATGLTREVDILKEANFPSLITLLAFSMDSTRALMVLPYCEGGDLFDFIENHGPVLKNGENGNSKENDDLQFSSWHLIRRIFAEVVNAVVYLHSKNVVHRDIKLENILLKFQASKILAMPDPENFPEPLCALTDLGLARRIDPEQPMLTTRCGSDDYVPPEIMMGRPYDGRETDSWALGVLLYAMIERRLPFDPPHNHGPKARNRISHRIARVEWSWIKFADIAEEKLSSNPWTGATEIVEGCLQRREQRWNASQQIINHSWLFEASHVI